MINNKSVAVVLPCYNEEKQIGMVIESLPDFVDKIVVVNDCSTDNTAKIVTDYMKKYNGKNRKKNVTTFKRKIIPAKYNQAEIIAEKISEEEEKKYIKSDIYNKLPEKDRIILINHQTNGGVGAAIAQGYKFCLEYNIECAAVMDGDGQMDPAELESICKPIVFEDIDFVKGNRLIHRSALFIVPKVRYFGNSILSLLTKIASGYWHVSDSQCGYCAMSLKALRSIRLYDLYKNYGIPNDRLVKLNIAFCTIREVEVKPVYNIGEKSKMNIFKVIPRISWLLFKLFLKRLWIKYLFRDFHPLFLLYNLSFILGLSTIPVIISMVNKLINNKSLTYQSLIIFLFLSISSFQSLLFAMWMDIQDNERLHK